MALQISITQNTDIELKEAYLRVDEVCINKSSKYGTVSFLVFKDKTARDNGANAVYGESRNFKEEYYDKFFDIKVLDNINPIKQAYLFLKTTDFQDSQDV